MAKLNQTDLDVPPSSAERMTNVCVRNAERKVFEAELEFSTTLFRASGCRWSEAEKNVS